MFKARLGAAGWQHPAWSAEFYPDGMPAEWQLTFYNTQFGCVWVDWSIWSGLSSEVAVQWVEETHAQFRFVLESPPEGLTAPAEVLQTLGDRVGRMCASDAPSLVWLAAPPDLRVLRQQIETLRQTAAPEGEIYLLSRDGDLATLEQVGVLLGLLGL